MRILLVEDEPRLAATVSKGLQAAGFVVVAASNGLDGLGHATEQNFDAIVLDIMLPGLSGYEVLRRLRAREVWTPVLTVLFWGIKIIATTLGETAGDSLAQTLRIG